MGDPWLGVARPWADGDDALGIEGAVVVGRCNVFLPEQGPQTTSATGLVVRTRDGREVALYWRRQPAPSGSFVVVPLVDG